MATTQNLSQPSTPQPFTSHPFTPADILLSGKAAIVTGGGAGIGKGIALAFARFGADVVVADKDTEAGQATADEINNLPAPDSQIGRCLSVPTDVRDFPQTEAMVAATLEHFGRLDILVNNAGGTRMSPFLELGEVGWQRHIDLNFKGLFGPTDAAAKAMVAQQQGGVIINVSSIEATRAAPLFSVYAACKAGMLNFTRTMALELADHNIRVNAIAPDVVDSPHLALFDEQFSYLSGGEEGRRRAVPLSRSGTPDEIAAPCVFLASEMGRYITGATLPIDGGTHASSGWTRDSKDRWTLFPV